MKWLYQHARRQDREITAIKDDMLSFAKMMFKDLTEIKGQLIEQRSRINYVIGQLGVIGETLVTHEKLIQENRFGLLFLSNGLTNVIFEMERHMTAYDMFYSDV